MRNVENSTTWNYLTVAEVCELTGLPTTTLRYWRKFNKGPKSFKIGRRTMYDRQDVEDWINHQKEQTTRGGKE